MGDFFKDFYGGEPRFNIAPPSRLRRNYDGFGKTFQKGMFGTKIEPLRKDEMDPMTRAARGEPAMGQIIAGQKPKKEWENPLDVIKPGVGVSIGQEQEPQERSFASKIPKRAGLINPEAAWHTAPPGSALYDYPGKPTKFKTWEELHPEKQSTGQQTWAGPSDVNAPQVAPGEQTWRGPSDIGTQAAQPQDQAQQGGFEVPARPTQSAQPDFSVEGAGDMGETGNVPHYQDHYHDELLNSIAAHNKYTPPKLGAMDMLYPKKFAQVASRDFAVRRNLHSKVMKEYRYALQDLNKKAKTAETDTQQKQYRHAIQNTIAEMRNLDRNAPVRATYVPFGKQVPDGAIGLGGKSMEKKSNKQLVAENSFLAGRWGLKAVPKVIGGIGMATQALRPIAQTGLRGGSRPLG